MKRVAVAVVLWVATGPLWAAEMNGRLEWSRRVELGIPVSGVVAEVKVQPGERVRKGQPLVVLDLRPFKAAVRRAEAQVTRLAAAAAEAEREAGRAQELYDRTLLSQHELEVANIARTDAVSQRVAAEAGLQEARIALDYATLEAPFDAIVLDHQVAMGQSVISSLESTPLVTLAEGGQLQLRVELPVAQLAALREGQQLPVTISGNHYQGQVTRIALEPLSGEGEPLYPVIIALPSASEGLRAGMAAAVTLP